jgi:hypothetical protein
MIENSRIFCGILLFRPQRFPCASERCVDVLEVCIGVLEYFHQNAANDSAIGKFTA